MIILDRYEGNYAICEIDGRTKQVIRTLIDINVKEGDSLIWHLDEQTGRGHYITNAEATKQRKDKINHMYSELQKSSKSIKKL